MAYKFIFLIILLSTQFSFAESNSGFAKTAGSFKSNLPYDLRPSQSEYAKTIRNKKDNVKVSYTQCKNDFSNNETVSQLNTKQATKLNEFQTIVKFMRPLLIERFIDKNCHTFFNLSKEFSPSQCHQYIKDQAIDIKIYSSVYQKCYKVDHDQFTDNGDLEFSLNYHYVSIDTVFLVNDKEIKSSFYGNISLRTGQYW